MVIIGTILEFIPCGMFATLATTYASDICPPNVSDYLTGYVNVCWVIGQIVTTGLLWAVMDLDTYTPCTSRWPCSGSSRRWSWSAATSPPSRPSSSAARSATTTRSSTSTAWPRPARPSPAEDKLSEIRELIQMEAELHIGSSYSDCFRGSNIRRTEIALMVSVGQLLVGFGIASEVVYFLQLTGLESRDSFKVAFGKQLSAQVPADRLAPS